MHFEFLIEDASGKIALEHLIPKIIGPHNEPHTWRIIDYKGVGSVPKDIHKEADPRKKILLDKLPTLLRAYGKTFEGYGVDYRAAIIVICDLDQRDLSSFMEELSAVLQSTNPRPATEFHLAIEEGEAWLLGDRAAIETAYPGARRNVLDSYVQDSICGTWETLAEAVYPKGSAHLKQLGFPATGQAKCEWAQKIAPLMDIESNSSPSFSKFVQSLRNTADGEGLI